MTVTSRRISSAAALSLLTTVVIAACGSDDDTSESSGRPHVLAALYPLAYVAEQIGGDAIEVQNLTQPGVEPHDLELTPRQVGDIADTDLVIYLAGFQPAVDEAVEQNAAGNSLDVSAVVPLELAAPEDEHADEGEEEGHEETELTGDPHVWLDPTKLATVATAVADSLAEIDSTHASDYEANAADLIARLTALDDEYQQALAACERRELVTSHAAFGYLAARYDLEQIPISGLSPEQEPPPGRLVEIQHEVEEHGITTIFFETLVSPDLAETIARDTGATTAVLDPIEGIKDTSQDDYFTVMRANLGALTQALGCS